MTSGKTFLVSVALVVGSFGVSLAIGELAIRAAGITLAMPILCPGQVAGWPSRNFTADPIIGWRMRPSHIFQARTEEYTVRYEADAQGFRDGYRKRTSAATRRIVVVGDSFAWGLGVNSTETFARILETELGSTEVRNLGMTGYGLDQIWLSLRHYGFPEKPDLAIVAIYTHDLERSMSAFLVAGRGLFEKPTFKLVGAELVRRGPEDCHGPIRRFLEKRSAIWLLWRRAMQQLERDHGDNEYWAVNKAILDAIRADCERAGTRVLFVHIPPSTLKPFPALDEYMRRSYVPYLDLSKAFGRDGAKYYYPRDGHFNVAGHRRVAELLLDKLRN